MDEMEYWHEAETKLKHGFGGPQWSPVNEVTKSNNPGGRDSRGNKVTNYDVFVTSETASLIQEERKESSEEVSETLDSLRNAYENSEFDIDTGEYDESRGMLRVTVSYNQ